MLDNKEPEILIQQEQRQEVKKEPSKVRLANCLQEADTWFFQAKQTTIEILEEEKGRYNPYQEFIDQYGMGLDEIIISLSEELEDYKTECYKRYPQK